MDPAQFGFILNSREWAALTWLGVIVLFVGWRRQVWASIGSVLSVLFKWQVYTVFAFFITWILIMVWGASHTGLWVPEQTKDTLLWILVIGFPLLIRFDQASEADFFSSRAAEIAGLSAVIEFLIGLRPFPYGWELALQFIVFMLVVAPLILPEGKDRALCTGWRNKGLTIIGIAVLAHTVAGLITAWGTLDGFMLLRSFALPVWLGLGALPFVFGFALVATYEQALMRLHWAAEGYRAPWHARIALLALGWRLQLVQIAAKGGTYRVARGRNFRESSAALLRLLQDEVARRKNQVDYAKALVENEGVVGLEADGSIRDKRELRETRRALEWLATCMLGHYKREPRGYKGDLVERFGDDFTGQGLPRPSQIQLEVMPDGQAWRAWRRLPQGKVLAIGSCQPEGYDYKWEGDEPPVSYPPADGWVGALEDDSSVPNWAVAIPRAS